MRHAASSRAGALGAVLAALATVAWASPAAAQSPPAAPTTLSVGDWQLAPSLELRTRGEYRHDPPDLGGLDFYGRTSQRVRDAWGVSERSRLGLEADHGALRAKITLQDARAAGTAEPTASFYGSPGIDRIAPYEAFIEVRQSSPSREREGQLPPPRGGAEASAAGRPAYVRLGRQAVVWGEGRLVGDADFSPVGRSLDAARGHVAAGNFDFEALAAILEMPGPLGSAFADTAGPAHSGVQLYGVLGKWTAAPLLRVELYALARMARSTGGLLDGSRFQTARLAGETYTGALRVSGDSKGWTYGVEGAYQLGRADSLAVGGADVRAFAAAAHVSKLLEQVALTPTFRISASYASGDDGGGTYRQFDPLLPDPQRFHGQTDLFAWSNEMDAAGRASIVPWRDTSFGVEYRYARLAQCAGEWIGSYLHAVGSPAPTGGLVSGAGASPIVDEELGHELDVAFAWRPWLPLELRAGWSGLLLGAGAKAIMAAHARGRGELDGSVKPPTTSQYAYVQATLLVP
jgi:hypothetical protein